MRRAASIRYAARSRGRHAAPASRTSRERLGDRLRRLLGGARREASDHLDGRAGLRDSNVPRALHRSPPITAGYSAPSCARTSGDGLLECGAVLGDREVDGGRRRVGGQRVARTAAGAGVVVRFMVVPQEARGASGSLGPLVLTRGARRRLRGLKSSGKADLGPRRAQSQPTPRGRESGADRCRAGFDARPRSAIRAAFGRLAAPTRPFSSSAASSSSPRTLRPSGGRSTRRTAASRDARRRRRGPPSKAHRVVARRLIAACQRRDTLALQVEDLERHARLHGQRA